MNMYSIKNLSFAYDRSKPIFSDFSCSFAKNTLTFVKGKNGSGKSTFFSILAGTASLSHNLSGAFDTGTHVFDIATAAYINFAHTAVHTVPQNFDLLLAPHLPAKENLACAHFSYHPSMINPLKEVHYPELLNTFNIPQDVPARALSGGQRQILAITMALQKNVELLLLDEPTSTLDEENAHLVMKFLLSLIKERPVTILMICHDADMYAYSPDNIIELKK